MEIGDSLEKLVCESARNSVWVSLDDLMDELVRDANGRSYVDDLVSTFVWDSVGTSVCDSAYDSVFMSVECLENEVD